ncbi:helix-turn-helix transcriptional regulator [Chryseobacterium sp. ISL-6]|uniref:helix-turn-helix domain-containing protein n=1 Tax=Chryseobacterium sp. ISL-6 TaxID=2819143 RepID=UPI001BE61746|nr:helix-turn-helix transcriptional regulator [Chryseobacterium sp. ISL-6]MBT2623519.1 helix-turn-helix transcriptional regulator [Chryseobacterium sp. ISL-6]
MEKLRSLRKQRGYTQEYMSNILSTDVSNYCRKENGDVKIFEDEWEKLAKALDVPVEEIKEERGALIQNNDNNSATFNDHAGNFQSTNYTYCNIPDYILENQQDYINLLKEQIEALKEENKRLKSGK